VPDRVHEPYGSLPGSGTSWIPTTSARGMSTLFSHASSGFDSGFESSSKSKITNSSCQRLRADGSVDVVGMHTAQRPQALHPGLAQQEPDVVGVAREAEAREQQHDRGDQACKSRRGPRSLSQPPVLGGALVGAERKEQQCGKPQHDGRVIDLAHPGCTVASVEHVGPDEAGEDRTDGRQDEGQVALAGRGSFVSTCHDDVLFRTCGRPPFGAPRARTSPTGSTSSRSTG
jgi:hypothetical protein